MTKPYGNCPTPNPLAWNPASEVVQLAAVGLTTKVLSETSGNKSPVFFTVFQAEIPKFIRVQHELQRSNTA